MARFENRSIHRPALALLAAGVLAYLALVSAGTAVAQTQTDEEPQHVCIGADLAISTGQTAHGDVSVTNGNLSVTGAVQGSAVVVNGNADVDGQVTGDLTVTRGSIKLGPHARIGGNVLAVMADIQRDPAAKVTGKVMGDQSAGINLADGLAGIAQSSTAAARHLGPLDRLGMVLAWGTASLVLLVLSVVVVAASPRRVRVASATLEAQAGPSVIMGAITALLLGPIAGLIGVVLVVTMVGWVLVPVLAVVAGIVCLFGLVVTSTWLGRRVHEAPAQETPGRFTSTTIQMLLGMAVLLSSTLVPAALLPGWVALMMLGLIYVAACVGLGALILSRFGTLPPPRVPSRTLSPAAVSYLSSPGTPRPQPHGAGNTEPLGPLPHLPGDRPRST